MEYDDWRGILFEETYPRLRFDGGTLLWVNQHSLKAQWGDKEYILDLDEFYQENNNPVKSVIDWAYRNLPLKKEELPSSHIYWNGPTNSFSAVVIRPNGYAYSQAVDNPQVFTRYGAIDHTIFTWSLKGSMLCIESKTKGIPALCPLSHPISLETVMKDFFYPTEEIHLMVSVKNPQQVFIGHKQPMERIKDEDRGVLSFPLIDWISNISSTQRLPEEK